MSPGVELEDSAASAILKCDLLWLLERDPATFGALQRKLPEYVAEVVKKSG